MYTIINFKTKKALKEAVASGAKVGVFNPGLGGIPPSNGFACIEGPHYPKPHTWYAEVVLVGGFITKVK